MKKYLFAFIAIFGIISLQAQMSILLVNDNGYDPERVEVIKTAITNSGFTYAYWDAPVEQASPSATYMSPFDLVIWYTGNDGGSLYLWNGDETENQEIKEYIDNGGMFWLQGLDFLYDFYPATPATFLSGEFVYDYLGISYYHGQSHIDDGVWSDGVPQLDLVEGNGIFTLDPVLWTYDYMWYVDAVEKVESASYIYQMGPSGYDLSDYYAGIYYEKGDGKVLSFTFETARIDSQDNTDILFAEALTYFEQFASPGVLVEQVNLSSEGGATSIDENFATLQFYAEVLPENATIPFVAWSVVSNGVDASINQDGLLQASGNDNGNGTIWVKAEAMDGSGIADSVQIEISGQGTEFTVLLVNDNANGTDRYLVLDTTLLNLGYIYNVYNTASTGDFPDFITLDSYDAVLWYTGNDGVSLKLWDVNDTTGAVNENVKFNAPLMQYINGGGIVWVQGLDFIYDIYGGAFDVFEPGDFFYDFMGIGAYVAQSYVDGDPLLQLDVVDGNSICSFSPIEWVYEEGLYYADALEITEGAEGIYTMGPGSYIYSDYYAGVYTQPGQGHLFTLTVETARIDTRDNTEEFFGEVLEYFESLVPDAVGEIDGRNFTVTKNYPNPVLDQTTFGWELDASATVSLNIFDITGRKVFSNNFGQQAPGNHSFTLSTAGIQLTNGVYTYSIKVNDQVVSSKMIVRK